MSVSKRLLKMNSTSAGRIQRLQAFNEDEWWLKKANNGVLLDGSSNCQLAAIPMKSFAKTFRWIKWWIWIRSLSWAGRSTWKIRDAATNGAYYTTLRHDELRCMKIRSSNPPLKGLGYWLTEFSDRNRIVEKHWLVGSNVR